MRFHVAIVATALIAATSVTAAPHARPEANPVAAPMAPVVKEGVKQVVKSPGSTRTAIARLINGFAILGGGSVAWKAFFNDWKDTFGGVGLDDAENVDVNVNTGGVRDDLDGDADEYYDNGRVLQPGQVAIPTGED